MRNIIAVDIGNTETTVGIGSKDNWDSYRFTTRDTNTPDELLALFNSTFQIKSEVNKDIEGAIICSVVPQATNSFSEAIRKYLNLEPIIVGPGIKTGLKVNIDFDSLKQTGNIKIECQNLKEFNYIIEKIKN